MPVPIEQLDPDLADEVLQVFTSDLRPFQAARTLYMKRRSYWIAAVRSLSEVRIAVYDAYGEKERWRAYPPQHIVNGLSDAIRFDSELMRISKTDGLETQGFDNARLARVFVIHIVAGEPYLAKR